MITMVMSQTSTGIDVAEAEWMGQAFRAENRSGATNALARALISAGAGDQPWVAVRGATVCLTGRSLHAHAACTLGETDRGFVAGWWTPHPEAVKRGEVDPRLQDALSASQQRARTVSTGQTGTHVPLRPESPLAGVGATP